MFGCLQCLQYQSQQINNSFSHLLHQCPSDPTAPWRLRERMRDKSASSVAMNEGARKTRQRETNVFVVPGIQLLSAFPSFGFALCLSVCSCPWTSIHVRRCVKSEIWHGCKSNELRQIRTRTRTVHPYVSVQHLIPKSLALLCCLHQDS